MEIMVKPQIETGFRTDDDGYLHISQKNGSVKLSCQQVKLLLKLLEDGAGLCLEQDWGDGVRGD